MMAEDHEKLDLSHLTERKQKELDEAQQLVHVEKAQKDQLRDIKETMESERREFTEEECMKVLSKAANLHEATQWFVEQEDSPIAPGVILGIYHQLAEEVSLMKKADVDEEVEKTAYYHFSKVIDTLAEYDFSAKMCRGNYEYDAAEWNPRAAEGQTSHPEVDIKTVGEVGPYQSLN